MLDNLPRMELYRETASRNKMRYLLKLCDSLRRGCKSFLKRYHVRKVVTYQKRIQPMCITLFGLGNVGKTSLVKRFKYDSFGEEYIETIEDKYNITVPYSDNTDCDVNILDTSGTYQFPAMRRHAIEHSDGFILVYSVDKYDSLIKVQELYKEITTIKTTNNVPILLVGNKIDKHRHVSQSDVEAVLDNWEDNILHIETSAKSNHNVSLAFTAMIGMILSAKTKIKNKRRM